MFIKTPTVAIKLKRCNNSDFDLTRYDSFYFSSRLGCLLRNKSPCDGIRHETWDITESELHRRYFLDHDLTQKRHHYFRFHHFSSNKFFDDDEDDEYEFCRPDSSILNWQSIKDMKCIFFQSFHLPARDSIYFNFGSLLFSLMYWEKLASWPVDIWDPRIFFI